MGQCWHRLPLTEQCLVLFRFWRISGMDNGDGRKDVSVFDGLKVGSVCTVSASVPVSVPVPVTVPVTVTVTVRGHALTCAVGVPMAMCYCHAMLGG